MSAGLENRATTETQQMKSIDRQKMMNECYLRLVGAAATMPEGSDARRVLSAALTKLIDYVVHYDKIDFNALIGSEGFWLTNSKEEEVVITLSAFRNLISLYNSHSESFDRFALSMELNATSKRTNVPAARNRLTPHSAS